MESKQAPSDSNFPSAQVTQELQPSKNGNELQFSKSKISIASEGELKNVLKYVMVLVGIKAQNMPNEFEKQVLINFITKYYGNQSPDSIRLAFESAIMGQFEVDVNCYENFSAAYFGRIMSTYINWLIQPKHTLKTLNPS